MSDSNNKFDNSALERESLTGRDLLEMDIAALENLFAEAAMPEISEFDGGASCLWLAGSVSGLLLGPLKSVKSSIAVSSLFPWKGMKFERSHEGNSVKGANLFYSGFKAFYFAVESGYSIFDDKECVVFDYDVDGNNLIFKALRDEVRKINDRLYLGRGNILSGAEYSFIAFFTVEPH